jgi:hypothetical protein
MVAVAAAAVIPVAAVIPEADLVVVILEAADAPPSVVAEALDQVATCTIQVATCTILGTPTRATLTHGVETETGMATAAHGMETETGMATVAHGMETETGVATETGTDMATKGSAVMTVFPSDSTRIGTQVGGITITDILIIGVTGTGTAIPMTITLTTAIRTTAIRTTVTTLDETGQRASKW